MAAYRSLSFRYYAPGDVRREELTIECGPRGIIVKVLASALAPCDAMVTFALPDGAARPITPQPRAA